MLTEVSQAPRRLPRSLHPRPPPPGGPLRSLLILGAGQAGCVARGRKWHQRGRVVGGEGVVEGRHLRRQRDFSRHKFAYGGQERQCVDEHLSRASKDVVMLFVQLTNVFISQGNPHKVMGFSVSRRPPMVLASATLSPLTQVSVSDPSQTISSSG